MDDRPDEELHLPRSRHQLAEVDQPLAAVLDRFRFNMRNVIMNGSIIPCPADTLDGDKPLDVQRDRSCHVPGSEHLKIEGGPMCEGVI